MAKTTGRRRQDHLARKAQADGYRARSVYKLEALDDRYHILTNSGARVLDLGAAPGSWTQYALQRGARVVAIDLKEMNVAGATCLCGDFTTDEIASQLASYGPFNVVMSDAAPSTTGNRLVDTGRSEALVDSIFARLSQWLVPGGCAVCKIFQGGGEQRLMKEARERFEKGVLFRPKAVRKESFETYVVALGYRGEG